MLDLRGRRITRFRAPEAVSLVWDGRLEGGVLAPGAYLVRIRSDAGRTVTRRWFWLGR